MSEPGKTHLFVIKMQAEWTDEFIEETVDVAIKYFPEENIYWYGFAYPLVFETKQDLKQFTILHYKGIRQHAREVLKKTFNSN